MTALYGGVLGLFLSALVIYLNERHQLLRGDQFPGALAKWAAYLWLTLFVVLVGVVVAFSSEHADEINPESLTFWSLFNMHLILLIFLVGWWALSGTPPVTRYMNIEGADAGPHVVVGLIVGVAGWALTIAVAMGVALILVTLKLIPAYMEPSPIIPWMAELAPWKKVMLIASAMTVEEAFFRGWLQKRVGLIASTVVFALGHAGYGQPVMLIGITVFSLLVGYTFYRTRSLIPCIVAHGVFDAIQLFIVVPLALRFL